MGEPRRRAERPTRQGGRSPQLRLRRGEAVQRQVPRPGGTDASYAGAAPRVRTVARMERAEQPRLPAQAVQEEGRRWVSRAPSTTPRSATRSTRESRPRCSRGEGRLRSHWPPRGNNSPRSSRPSVSPLAFLRARQARRDEALRRLRAPPVLRQAERDADHAAEGEDRRGAGQHRRPDQGAHAPVRQEAALDHRVRLPDAAPGPGLRRPTPSRPPTCARRTGSRARTLGST